MHSKKKDLQKYDNIFYNVSVNDNMLIEKIWNCQIHTLGNLDLPWCKCECIMWNWFGVSR